MTSYLELFSSEEWVQVKKVAYGGVSTFTDFGEGFQTLYVFQSSNDNTTTFVNRLVDSGHALISRNEVLVPPSNAWEQVAELHNNEMYNLSITTREKREVDVRVVQRES